MLLVLSDATPPQPVNLFPSPPVVDELTQYDKIQEDCSQTSHQPREALDKVLALAALQQDTCDVSQVACDGKDKEGERKAFALCRPVLEDLWDTRREVENGREPACNLGIQPPADRFWDRGGLLGVVVGAVVVFGDPPCSHTCSDNEKSGESVHDDLGLDRRLFLVIGFGGEKVVLDDAPIADQRGALVCFERCRDGRDLDSAVVVL